MTWFFENLDQIIQIATLLSILGAGALLKAIYYKIGKIAALPSTVDKLSDSVTVLSSKLQQMDVDVKEAIGVKRHLDELRTRMATVESLLKDPVISKEGLATQ